MELNEVVITKAIIDRYMKKLEQNVDLDVAVVGGGPSGLVASYFVAKAGFRVALFERKLSIGGGMWGGGMMFNEVVVQEEGKRILDAFGIRTHLYEDGYYTADSIEAISTICSHTAKAGVTVFNLVSAEDVDRTLKNGVGFRYPWLGPLETVDLGGLDVFHGVSQYLLPELSTAQTTPEFFDRLVEEGKLGIKTGEGFYPYDADDRDEILRKRDLYFIRQLKLIREIRDS